jgi:lipoprotein-anchoring transpeptidase ErfK/SrfK
MSKVCFATTFAAAALIPGFAVTGATAREIVPATGYPAGTIVIHTSQRRLYYYLGDGTAVRYPVGVGRSGMQWTGTSYIDGKYVNPAWAPPQMMWHEKGVVPEVIPGGAPNNPMGVAAMTLHGGEYAIHGTNNPSSIGGFVSHGCIRMYNEDVTDLFVRVITGTPVVVTQ